MVGGIGRLEDLRLMVRDSQRFYGWWLDGWCLVVLFMMAWYMAVGEKNKRKKNNNEEKKKKRNG
jgi:hypothetical protein